MSTNFYVYPIMFKPGSEKHHCHSYKKELYSTDHILLTESEKTKIAYEKLTLKTFLAKSIVLNLALYLFSPFGS